MRSYPSLLSATKGLLGEVVQTVGPANVGDFAVIGGWSPFFLNGSPIPHPGSRDVDLLFREGRTEHSLSTVVETLLEAGYLHSAKHEFQLLRLLDVAGTTFVFNVDLLH